jgi:hypothetical protein
MAMPVPVDFLTLPAPWRFDCKNLASGPPRRRGGREKARFADAKVIGRTAIN